MLFLLWGIEQSLWEWSLLTSSPSLLQWKLESELSATSWEKISTALTKSLEYSQVLPWNLTLRGIDFGSEQSSSIWSWKDVASSGLTKSPSTIESWFLKSGSIQLSRIPWLDSNKVLWVRLSALSLMMATSLQSSEEELTQQSLSLLSLRSWRAFFTNSETITERKISNTKHWDRELCTSWTTLEFTITTLWRNTSSAGRSCVSLCLSILPGSTRLRVPSTLWRIKWREMLTKRSKLP